jgi:hypothetical protein
MDPEQFEPLPPPAEQDLSGLSELADGNLFAASEEANSGANHPNEDLPADNTILFQDSQQALS